MSAIVPAGQTALASFLERHPWPAEMAEAGRPMDHLWDFDLAVDVATLWARVSDTSRMNRAIGLSRMEFVEKDGVLFGSGRNAGIRQEWVETPWTWVDERTLTSVRRYSRGLARFVRAIYELEPLGERRTRFRVYFGSVPRGLWQRLLLGVGMDYVRKGYARVLGEIERAGPDVGAPAPYRVPAPPLESEAEARLEALGRRLRQEIEDPADEPFAQKLIDYVRAGDEMDLHRIQVVPLARRWDLDEDRALALFLRATRAGILALSWDVICPHCRGVREHVHTLGEVPRKSACAVCAIDFETGADHAIEITFQVHPSIRDVPKRYYCSAEPATKPHIKVQQVVGAGGRAEVATALAPGRYRARVRGSEGFTMFDVLEDLEPCSRVEWPSDGAPAAGGPRPILALENRAAEARTFVIEEARWADDALRPARLFSFQQFRDLFTEEFLAADIQLSVGWQTILFTDVVGSTKLYATRGDPGAFADVKRHFNEIYEEVTSHGGAIVKTIGDAAMAAFVDPVKALQTAQEIHRRFPEGRADLALRVRISLNTGPCIAVRLNTAIDYFGNTVNVAAKLQALAEAGQIAFTREMLDRPGVRAFLEAEGADTEHLTLDSSSLVAPVAAVRWTVASRGRSGGVGS